MRHILPTAWVAGLIAGLAGGHPAFADAPVVEAVRAEMVANAWTFHVTLSHGDTGWDDYADGWRIEDTAGAVLGTRVLHHPHVQEQPFTRSLSGVTFPADIDKIQVCARTNTEGWAENCFAFDLP